MNRTERITGILLALQGGSRTAGELAARFEVSRRTIMRDIDALGEMGVPVVALSGRSGGYSVSDGFWLPPLHLTVEEATALLFAMDNVGERDTSPLGEPHRTVVDKLQAILKSDVRTAVDRNLTRMRVVRDQRVPPANVLAALRNAMDRRAWCAIDYRSPNGTTSRTILPMHVYIDSGRWYAEAIDSLRRAIRVFRIDRITSVDAADRPLEADSIVAEASKPDAPYDHADHPEVHAVVTPRGHALALDHPDLRVSVAGNPDCGEIRFRCPATELPYYGREFLRFGTDIQLLAPPELRAWMMAAITEIMAHIGSHQSLPGSPDQDTAA